MSDAVAFPDLMVRVHAGDARAAEHLFQKYESQLRLEVRLRLRDPRLRRLVDEDDVCQSVMLSFFVRARLGEYELAEPGELMRLLVAMARNKVAAQARRTGANAAAPRDSPAPMRSLLPAPVRVRSWPALSCSVPFAHG